MFARQVVYLTPLIKKFQIFSEGCEEVAQQQVSDLLMLTYRLAMDHYPGGPQTCLHIHHTLQAVVDSAVSIKSLLSHV